MDWENIKYIFWVVLPVLGLIGFINALFSLKDRWKKWRATKSKKSFEKRLKFLEIDFNNISRNRFSSHMIILVISEAMPLIWGLVICFAAFVLSYFSYILFGRDAAFTNKFALVFAYISQSTLIAILSRLVSFTKFIDRVQQPSILAEEIIKLINKGKKNGFIDKSENELINQIIESEIFTEVGRKHLSKLAGVEYVNKLPTETNPNKM